LFVCAALSAEPASPLRRALRANGLTIGLASAPVLASLITYSIALRFYRGLGTTPAEAGLGAEGLITPVAVLLVTGVLAALSTQLGPKVGRYRLGGIACFIVLLLSVDTGDKGATPRQALAVWMVYVAAGVFLVRRRVRSRNQPPETWLRRGFDLFLLILAALGIVVGAAVVPDEQLKRFTDDGSSLSTTPFPMGLGPVLRFVRAVPHVAGLESLGSAACVLSVGDGQSGRILLVADAPGARARLVLVNSQLVSLEAPGRCAIELPDGVQIAP
jgi:hypothetical protein